MQKKCKAGGIFTHYNLFKWTKVTLSLTMAMDTVCENQHTISPRLNKQYSRVVNLGKVTVLYDRWKEWLSEHADHIKTLGKCISPPKRQQQQNKTNKKQTNTKTSFQTKPVCQSLSVKNWCLWVWVEYFALSVRETFFLFAIKKSQFS